MNYDVPAVVYFPELFPFVEFSQIDVEFLKEVLANIINATISETIKFLLSQKVYQGFK
jgi:hypothetical protein